MHADILIGHGHYQMEVETLSYAQSLRVIGQQLDGLGVDSFKLDKRGDQYIVQRDDSESAENLSREKTFPGSTREKIRGSRSFSREISKPLHFSTPDILRSDNAGRLRRGEPGGMPDVRNLSLVLRVIGDYLDRKSADDFAISWSTYSVKVSFGQKQESFTVDNLYDLGVHMYLKRSNRGPAKSYLL